jgi:hypothetical protein
MVVVLNWFTALRRLLPTPTSPHRKSQSRVRRHVGVHCACRPVDTHHDTFRRLFAAPPRLITTTLVVAEGHGWFLKRYDRTKALQFIAMIEAMTPLEAIEVGVNEQRGAGQLLRGQPQRR